MNVWSYDMGWNDREPMDPNLRVCGMVKGLSSSSPIVNQEGVDNTDPSQSQPLRYMTVMTVTLRYTTVLSPWPYRNPIGRT